MTEVLTECPCCHEGDGVTWLPDSLDESRYNQLELPIQCEKCGCEWRVHLTVRGHAIDKQPEPAQPPVKRYNHAFTLGFTIEVVGDPEGGNIDAETMRVAIIDRANALYEAGGIHEALGEPLCSWEIDP